MDTDPLSAALSADLSSSAPIVVSRGEALREAGQLLAEAERGDFTPWHLSRAFDLASQFPVESDLQRIAGKLHSWSGDDETSLRLWRAMFGRFPRSAEIFGDYIACLERIRGTTVARFVVDGCLPSDPGAAEHKDILLGVAGLAAIGEYESALDLLAEAKESVRRDDRIVLRQAELLERCGRLDEAIAILGTASGEGERLREKRRIEREIDALGSRTELSPANAAIESLLKAGGSSRGSGRLAFPSDAIGKTILIGGTLGGGGAERQLANTALGLAHRSRHRGRFDGPVMVFCRKLDRRRRNDFYLHKLEAEGVAVGDYLAVPEWGGDAQTSSIGMHRDLIDLLPERMREGVLRLTDILRYEAPEIVQLWQDGMIYTAGLAALLADVPRIVLNVRTMPPSERRDRQRPGSKTLYNGLLRTPGVTLVANSSAAARAYEDWLELEAGSVETIRNGVEALPVAGGDADSALWARFDEATGAGLLIGGVMRFDDNKRPLLWLEVAAALARILPEARFVLVGTGPLRAAAEERAVQLGIADRTLFAGRSQHVGFWLDKLDALGLTSRHEGAPNALIEAQLAGVPVVTTPAGGAPEAVAPHAANHVLADAQAPDPEEAARHLADLAKRGPAEIAKDSAALRDWASHRFSMDAMIERTLDIFAAG